MMTLEQIKASVDAGQKVFHQTEAYEVRKWSDGRYMIVCVLNNSAIGLTWLNGVTMNGKLEEFFTAAAPITCTTSEANDKLLLTLRELVRAHQAVTQAQSDLVDALPPGRADDADIQRGAFDLAVNLADRGDWRGIAAVELTKLLNIIDGK